MKDAYYFPHDANAHNDPKIQRMFFDLKAEGYGAYWVIIEMLRNEQNYTLNMSDYDAIAYQSHCDRTIVKTLIEKYDLFTVTDGLFWSESLKRRMETLEEKRKKLSESGILGNKIRWQSRGNREAIAVKQSKVKKRKEKDMCETNPPPLSNGHLTVKEPLKSKHLEFVMLTDNEHKKLIDKLGEQNTTYFIERLNNYIGSKGVKYKSHYHTILNWAAKEPVNKEPNDKSIYREFKG